MYYMRTFPSRFLLLLASSIDNSLPVHLHYGWSLISLALSVARLLSLFSCLSVPELLALLVFCLRDFLCTSYSQSGSVLLTGFRGWDVFGGDNYYTR
ncbi:hypothetical protein BDV09DRAFT_150919 [Aspergillus tetrazonus]